jgi:ribosomal protein S18 acetylase RimI-like enzyme
MSEAVAPDFEIVPAEHRADVESARRLFFEYAQGLGFSLCFQGFDAELAQLPGCYAPPRGALLLARAGGVVVGCVGVRPLDGDRCEMKRLYLQPGHRGRGNGRRLAEAAIAAAREAGYRRMCLDTIETMQAARALYREFGFRPIPAYYENPLPGVEYYELDLVPSEMATDVPAA